MCEGLRIDRVKFSECAKPIFKKLLRSSFAATAFFVALFLVFCQQASARTVKVGIFEGSNYYAIDENGEPSGYGYELLEGIARYTGFEYEFVRGSWAECLLRVQNGEIDLLDSVLFSPARSRALDFANYASGLSFCKVFVRENETRIQYNDFRALNGLKVGMLLGNAQNEIFLDYMAKSTIPTINKVYPTEAEMTAALASGEVDAIVSNSQRGNVGEKPVARLAPREYFIVTQKEDPDLMMKINDGLAKLLIENPNFIAHLRDKYFTEDGESLVLTEEERTFVKDARAITVVHDSYWAPFESYDETTGTVVGINADILRLISEKTGLRFEFLSGYTYEKCIEMVGNGSADMLLSYDSNPKKARSLKMRLSDTFLSTPIAILGDSDHVSTSSVFAVPRTYPVVEDYVRDIFPNNKVVLYDNIEGCYEAVVRGKADFTLENIYVAEKVISSGKYRGVQLVTVTALMDNFSFAFKMETNNNLINVMNKAIRTLSKSDREKILFGYSISQGEEISYMAFYNQHKDLILSAAALLLAGVAIVLGYTAFVQVRSKRRLWQMAYKDPLTGANNMNKFRMDATRILNEDKDVGHAIIKFDIDRFKFFNEMYSFDEGDRVLKTIAQTANTIGDTQKDTLARVGTDAFLSLLRISKSEEVRQMQFMFEKKFFELYGKDKAAMLKFPTGVYIIEQGETDVSKIFEKVNYAHRLAKQQKGDTIHYYDEKAMVSEKYAREIESRMEDALRDGRFVLYLQPKYALADESIAGAEALARWKDADGADLVYPNEFIRIFEQNGFIIKFDLYMLDKVCNAIRGWINNKIEPITVSVNFSRLHLTSHPTFLRDLCDIVDKYHIPRRYIEIEFTESSMSENEEMFMNMLSILHAAGFTISMDDFGTGYSSLGMLKNIPVDVIKMDKGFFAGTNDERRTETVVSHVVSLARDLCIQTVAEGVETREQVDMLKRVGCDIVQGYYYSKPIRENEFTKKLEAS